MLLYAITNRRLLSGDENARRDRLVALAEGWAHGGVDTIQVREKDLSLTELQALSARIVKAVRSAGATTRVLVNGPAQVALDAGADGVHLPSAATAKSPGESPSGMGAAAAQAAERMYERAGREAIVSAACHSPEEIRRATGASLVLFSPVFEKVTGERVLPGQGLASLRTAAEVAKPVPVLALGGVTEKNAAACVQAGAAGVAAIRLFLSDAWRALVQTP